MGSALPSRSQTRFDALTGLRAVLALWVAFYHFSVLDADGPPGDWAGPVVAHGYLAVDGFFLLSGLVIAEGYGSRLRQGGLSAWLAFVRARLARLYPIHLVTLVGMGAIVLGGSAVSGMPIHQAERFGTDALVWNLLLLHASPWIHRLTWNYPSWSIAAEFAAYAAAPLVLRAVPPARAWIVLPPAFAALAILHAIQGTLNLHLAGWALLRIAIEFPAGVALRHVVREASAKGLEGSRWLGLAALAATIVLAATSFDPGTVACLALLLAALTSPSDQLGRVLAHPVAVRLGEVSFALYMVHALVESSLIGLHRLGFPSAHWQPWAQALLGIVVSQALAFALFHAVERPGRTWLLSLDHAVPAAGPGRA